MAEEAVEVAVVDGFAVATLRYLTGEGEFARAAERVTGQKLPPPLHAVASDGGLILAWRSPSETWCLAPQESLLGSVLARLPATRDGHAVNLTGGLLSLRLRAGERIAELFGRLSGAPAPAPGQALRSRLADVGVMSVCVRAGELLLLTERHFVPHVLEWTRLTLADLGPAPGPGGDAGGVPLRLSKAPG